MPVVRALALFVLAVTAGCSARHAIEPLETVTCDVIMSAKAVTIGTSTLEHDWLWVTDVNMSGPTPAILNLRDVRLNGMAGYTIMISDQQWRVFGTQALRVNSVSAFELRGHTLDCATPEQAVRAFMARPLAPLEQRANGLDLIARIDGQAEGWPDERGSDLAALDAQSVVLARGPDGLRIVDTAQVEAGILREVSHVPASLDDDFNDVVVAQQRYAFAASRRRGVVVWDLMDRRAPRFVSDGFPERAPRDGHNLLLRADTLYVAQSPPTGTGALTAMDVSVPTRPRELWRFVPEPGHDVHDVAISGDRVYVSSLRGGLYVLRVVEDRNRYQGAEVVARLDVKNAHNVALLSHDDTTQRFLVVEERLAGELVMGEWDMAMPGRQVTIGRTTAASADTNVGSAVRFAASPHNLECERNLCFIAHYQLGLRVFDWTSRQEPRVTSVASFPTWHPGPAAERDWVRGASGVLLTSSLVYVLDTQNGLFALRRPRE